MIDLDLQTESEVNIFFNNHRDEITNVLKKSDNVGVQRIVTLIENFDVKRLKNIFIKEIPLFEIGPGGQYLEILLREASRVICSKALLFYGSIIGYEKIPREVLIESLECSEFWPSKLLSFICPSEFNHGFHYEAEEYEYRCQLHSQMYRSNFVKIIIGCPSNETKSRQIESSLNIGFPNLLIIGLLLGINDSLKGFYEKIKQQHIFEEYYVRKKFRFAAATIFLVSILSTVSWISVLQKFHILTLIPFITGFFVSLFLIIFSKINTNRKIEKIRYQDGRSFYFSIQH